MNIVIDCGNTRIKAATFLRDQLENKYLFSQREELKSFLQSHSFSSSIVSSVSFPADEVASLIRSEKTFVLNSSLPLPIKIQYKTPATLGVDRIASVCGARALFPKSDCLVIDAGTCVNYDFVDDSGNYLGGAISPGVSM